MHGYWGLGWGLRRPRPLSPVLALVTGESLSGFGEALAAGIQQLDPYQSTDQLLPAVPKAGKSWTGRGANLDLFRGGCGGCLSLTLVIS